jgi:hypothetical protein
VLAIVAGLVENVEAAVHPEFEVVRGESNCEAAPTYGEAVEALSKADVAIEAADYAAALQLIEAGIDQLGYRYQYSGLNDDTGTALSLAEFQKKLGNLPLAATLKRGVLKSRASAYCWKLAHTRTQR